MVGLKTAQRLYGDQRAMRGIGNGSAASKGRLIASSINEGCFVKAFAILVVRGLRVYNARKLISVGVGSIPRLLLGILARCICSSAASP